MGDAYIAYYNSNKENLALYKLGEAVTTPGNWNFAELQKNANGKLTNQGREFKLVTNNTNVVIGDGEVGSLPEDLEKAMLGPKQKLLGQSILDRYDEYEREVSKIDDDAVDF